MRKRRVNWWQAGLVGALIGLGGFYAHRALPRQHYLTCSEQEFFNTWANQDNDDTPFKDVVISPQMDGAYTISASYYEPRVQDFQKIQFEIPPDSETQAAAGGGASPRRRIPFVAMLRAYARDYSWIRYEYQWWREPRMLIWAYPLIGAYFFAGLALLLRLWRGAEPPESEYDLERFSQKSQEAASPNIPTAAESQQLDDAIDAAAIALGHQSSKPAADSTASSPIGLPSPALRKLDGLPLIQSPPTAAKADKDYEGEFYPTEIHHNDSKDV
jgi:hypothetical protein